jgi:uncharacterized protein
MRVSVTELNVYPVKSTRGAPRERVRVARTGFEWDRQWMIVDDKGTFLTQRSHPQLARIVPEVMGDALVLTAPGLPALKVPLDLEGERAPVRIWRDSCVGVDQGAAARDWATRAVGEPVRLVRVGPDMGRIANPQFAGPAPVPIAFPDGYPILVCSEASLEDLNARLPQPVPMDRFRPNIVVRGIPPWAEDRIDTITIGPLALRLVKPCTRCKIPSIDQLTGEDSTDPTPALKAFRFSKALLGVMFGENAVIAAGVGSVIERGAEGEVTFERASAPAS